jgi:uncharacterized damage-inducible protein DinB
MELSVSALSRLSYQHLTIKELISEISETKMHFNPMPGKWSIHDNIAHLARYNVVFQERIQKMLKEYNPAFERYAAEGDEEFPRWQSRKTNVLMDSIQTERKGISIMASSMSEEQLTRTGIHPRFGQLTITSWLEFFLLHEAHHIFTIFQLKNVG